MLVLDFLVGGFEDKTATISPDPLDVSGFTVAYILHKIPHPAQKNSNSIKKSLVFSFICQEQKTLHCFTQPHIECEQI